jgi:hypothetical protein
MAVFFSKAQSKYKCFKCLLEEQDLIYIDKKYVKQMEDFEAIKKETAKSIKKSHGKENFVNEWRLEIRNHILKVKAEFTKWIESFTT